VLAAGCRSELNIWLMRSRDYHRNRRNTTLEQKYGYFIIFRPRNEGAEAGYRGNRRHFWPIRSPFSFQAIHSGCSFTPCNRSITAVGPAADLKSKRARGIGRRLGAGRYLRTQKLAVD
jgi:hypothetical protein